MGVVVNRQLTKAAWSRVQFCSARLYLFSQEKGLHATQTRGTSIIPSSRLSYGVYRWMAPVHRAPKYSTSLFSNFCLIIVVHIRVYEQLFHCSIFMHVYRALELFTPLLICHAHLPVIL